MGDRRLGLLDRRGPQTTRIMADTIQAGILAGIGTSISTFVVAVIKWLILLAITTLSAGHIF